MSDLSLHFTSSAFPYAHPGNEKVGTLSADNTHLQNEKVNLCKTKEFLQEEFTLKYVNMHV